MDNSDNATSTMSFAIFNGAQHRAAALPLLFSTWRLFNSSLLLYSLAKESDVTAPFKYTSAVWLL